MRFSPFECSYKTIVRSYNKADNAIVTTAIIII